MDLRPAATVWLRAYYFVLAFAPILALLGASIGAPGLADELRLPSSARLGLLGRSLALSGGVSVIAVALAFFVALRLSRSSRGRLVGLFVLSLAAIPPYVQAQAWSGLAVSLDGWWRSVGAPAILPLAGGLGVLPGGSIESWGNLPAFQGPLAAGWVQTAALLPLAIGLAVVALETVPEPLIDAARLARGDEAALWRVVLPLALPMLGATTALALLLSLLDYSIPALYQVNVYSLAVFAEYSATHSAGRAVGYALPLILVSTVAVLMLLRGARAVAGRSSGARRPTRRLELGLPTRIAETTAIALSAAMVCLPPLALLNEAGGLAPLRGSLTAARSDVAFSFGIAAGAALIVVPGAVGLGSYLARRRSAMWWLAATLPMALPAPLVGIGMIHLWNRGDFTLYGTAAMPVLASAARFAPVAALVCMAHAARMNSALVDAARVHQTSRLQGWLAVLGPMWLPGAIAAAAIVFVLTLGELGATLLVVPPGRGTLTLRIFNYLHYGASDTVAGLGLVMAAVSAVGGAIAVGSLGLLRRRRSAE